MATVASLLISLRARTDQLDADIRKANKIIAQLRQELQSTGNVASTVASQFSRLFALGAITAGIAQVVRITASFEDQLAGVRAVTGATAQEMQRLTAVARELGATTQFSASEAARGLQLLGQAGLNTGQIIDALPDVLTLAAAGSLELGRSAEIVSTTLAAFQLQATQAVRVADVLAVAAAKSNTNVEQLAEGLKFAAPTAGAFGRSVEETVAALSVLSNRGIQATLAGEGLRRILGLLVRPTDENRALFQSLGISLSSINPTTNDLVTIFQRLQPVLRDNRVAFQLFGIEGANVASILSQNTGELQSYIGNLQSSGQAAAQAIIRQDSLAGSFRELRSTVEEAQLQIGQEFSEALRDTIQVVRELIVGTDGLASSIGIGLAAAFRIAGVAASVSVGAFQVVGKTLGGVAAAIDSVQNQGGSVGFREVFKLLGQDISSIFSRTVQQVGVASGAIEDATKKSQAYAKALGEARALAASDPFNAQANFTAPPVRTPLTRAQANTIENFFEGISGKQRGARAAGGGASAAEGEARRAAREAQQDYEQEVRRLTTLIQTQRDFVNQQTLTTDSYKRLKFETDLAKTSQDEFEANLYKGTNSLQEQAQALFEQGQAAAKARENIERLAGILEQQRDAALQVTLTAEAYEALRFQEELTGAAEQRYQQFLSQTTDQLREHILAAREVVETRKQIAAQIDQQLLGVSPGVGQPDLSTITPQEGLQRALDANIDISEELAKQLVAYENLNTTIASLRSRGTQNLQTFAANISEAFGSAGDAIADLVRTGQLDFSRLIDSILADLVRLSVQQAIIKPIGNAFTQALQAGTSSTTSGGGGGFDFAGAATTLLGTLAGGFGFGGDAGNAATTIQGFRNNPGIASAALPNAMGGIVSNAGQVSLRAFAGGGIAGFEDRLITNRGRINLNTVPLQRFQTGGVARSPQLALFGETSTPEAFVPVPSGRIPVELRGGQALNTFNNQFIFPGVTNRQDADGIRRSQNQISAQVLQGISRSQARDNINPTAGKR